MITLKGIKHSKFASHETHCYQATVYFNGRKAAQVSNQGMGGCDDCTVLNAKVFGELIAYIAALPEVESTLAGDHAFRYHPTLETECNNLVSEWIARKDLNAMLKNRVVMVLDGEVRMTKITRDRANLERWTNQLRAEHPTARILNDLKIDAAFKLYMECV